MKKLLTLLPLYLIVLVSNALQLEKFPEVPWRAIVDMHGKAHFTEWTEDIEIKLFGNYTTVDSIIIENSMTELNALTETIQLKFSNRDRGNLEIYFLDSINNRDYKNIITLDKDGDDRWSYSTLQDNYKLFSQAININLVPLPKRQNYLTNTLAFALFPVFWNDAEYLEYQNRDKKVEESIYRALSIGNRKRLYFEDLHEFDKKLLSEVYSADFQKKLAMATEQFKPFISIPKWLRDNSYAFLLLPFGVLLLLLTMFYLWLIKKTKRISSNNFLQFNIHGLIAVVLLAIVGALYFSVGFAIKYDNFTFYRYIKNLIAGFFMLSVMGLPAVNLLRLVEKLIHKNTHRKTLKIVLIFLSTGLIPFSAFLAMFLYSIRNRPHEILQSDIRTLSYVFLGCIFVASLRALISYFIFKEKDLIFESETKLSKLRELKTKAELNALHSRVNPHFLYNSLNSIAGLAHSNADQTEHMALSLSKLFRYSINKEKSDWTTINEELEMVKIYLDVEKVRFNDRLVYSVVIPDELKEQKIPRFIIQPLVENAVKHGISKSVEGGNIKVEIQKDKKGIVISVADSGREFPKDLTPGFGLQSIYDKLEILYNDRFELSFTNSPIKQVSLKLR
ncbi:sensor histidine kinase [Maribellus sediminis]|uniref:sensor histidine kinase n=1 Tax=Maribellus sediminis TaxID=2696285 RepID=UPI00142FF691|nr:histidine kinase [Maribellus sediminis]